jgi:glutathione S-transferase
VGLANSLLKPGQKFLFDGWTVPDTELAFALNRLVHNGDPVPENLRTYVQAQLARPCVAEFMQRERQPYIEYA